MRQKELKLVITFPTTSDAIEMEKVCKKAGSPGRLIPLPQQISAGCGLAWCAQLEQRVELLQIIQSNGFQSEQIYTIEV
jgi:hypothetical protein